MLKKIKELASDSLVYGLSTIIGQIASLFLVPYFTKALNPEDYGVLNMTGVLIAFIAPVAGLGMDSALFRYYSLATTEEEKKGYFTTATVLKTLAVIITVLLILPFYQLFNSWLFDLRLTSLQFYILIASFVCENFSTLSVVTLRSERKVRKIALVNIFSLVLGLILSIYFVLQLKWGITGAMLASLTSSIMRAVFYLQDSNKRFQFSFPSWTQSKKMLVYGLPMVPHKIQGFIITMFTSLIINHKMGIAYVGLYAVAMKVAKPISFLVTIVQQSWTPYKYQIHKTEKNPAGIFRDIISFYWIILIFLWIIACLLAPLIYTHLINHRYLEGLNYVPFIMMVSVIQAVYFTVTTGFELKENQKKIILGSFLGMVTLVVISLLTLDFYTPYSFIVAQCISFIVLIAVIYPEAKKFISIKYPFVPITVFFLVSVVLVWFSYHHYSNYNLSLVFIISCVCLLFTFKSVFPKYKLSVILNRLRIRSKVSSV